MVQIDSLVAAYSIPGVVGVAIVNDTHESTNATFHEIAGATVRIDWDHAPTEQEKAVVVPTLTAAVAIATKTADVFDWWGAIVADGYDTGIGWRMAMGDVDRDKFDQLRNQLERKKDDPDFGTKTRYLWDATGFPRGLLGPAAVTLLNAYADYIETKTAKFAEYGERIAASDLDFEPGVD
ncbi:MAG: hypothetical protein ACIALR_12890 [Blastopirellula sp. JB062]